MDVLYIVSKGSPYNNEALRYSLRTLEAHGQNIGRVIIVGENPGFLSEHAEFFAKPEVKGHRPHRITTKILYAIEKANLTGDFLLIAENVFFINDTDLNTIPYEYKSDLKTHLTHPDKRYFHTKQEAAQWLEKNDREILDYEMHKPFLFNGNKFLNLKKAWVHSKASAFGMVIQSVYANFFEVPGGKSTDVVMKHILYAADYEMLLNNYCFSCGDGGWERGIETWLQTKYSNPSKYEVS